MALIESTRKGRPLFRVKWNYYRDENGKQRFDEKKYLAASNDPRDVARARRKAKAFNDEKTVATTSETERLTVNQLADLWFQKHVEAVDHAGNRYCAQRTEKDYREQYNLRIKPYLGRKRVAKLTPATIDEWQQWMLEQTRVVKRRRLDADGNLARRKPTGRQRNGTVIVDTVEKPATAAVANKSLATFKAMIAWGRSKGFVTNRALDAATGLPQKRPAPANPYTPDEVKRIANGCDRLLDETLVYVAAYSGLRWSELCALEWSDIDFNTNVIDLTKALDLDRTNKAPKSHRQRIVPVLDPGLEALRRWREHAPDTTSLVFPDEKGGPLRSNWYARNLVKIRASCKIHVEPHQLRDTYASILIQTTGIGEAELTMWLGHRSIQTTIDRYGKLFEKRKAKLAAIANRALAAGEL